MTRRAAGLERLDDHHASAAARAGMRRLLSPCRAIVSLLLLRRLHRSRRHRCGDQLAGVRQRLGFGSAARQQAVMPDAMEALRQHVQHEPADELARLQRHRLVPAGAFDPVILVLEPDALLVGVNTAAVRERHAMWLAGEGGKST